MTDTNEMRKALEAAETHSAALARALEEARAETVRLQTERAADADMIDKLAKTATAYSLDQNPRGEVKNMPTLMEICHSHFHDLAQVMRARPLLAPKEDTANG